jgi:hypothetical protein
MTWTGRGRIQSGAIVLEAPPGLPEGSDVLVQLERCDAPDSVSRRLGSAASVCTLILRRPTWSRFVEQEQWHHRATERTDGYGHPDRCRAGVSDAVAFLAAQQAAGGVQISIVSAMELVAMPNSTEWGKVQETSRATVWPITSADRRLPTAGWNPSGESRTLIPDSLIGYRGETD